MPDARSDEQSYDGKRWVHICEGKTICISFSFSYHITLFPCLPYAVWTPPSYYSKVGADSVQPMSAGFSSTGLSSGKPSVASGQSSNLYNASSDMLTPMDNEDQFVIYAPAGNMGVLLAKPLTIADLDTRLDKLVTYLDKLQTDLDARLDQLDATLELLIMDALLVPDGDLVLQRIAVAIRNHDRTDSYVLTMGRLC
jgi:hypothetical protein